MDSYIYATRHLRADSGLSNRFELHTFNWGMQAREAALAGIHAKLAELKKELATLKRYENTRPLGPVSSARKARIESIIGNLEATLKREEARAAGYAYTWQMEEANQKTR